MRTLPAISFLALAITACDADPSTLAADQAAPPLPYEFAAGEVFTFAPIRLTVAGVAAGSRIAFLGSPNALGSGPCPPQLQGGCIDLAPPVITIGTAVANVDGWASIEFPTPAALGFGDVVAFQAVVRDAPGAWTPTLAVEKAFGPGFCPFIFAPVCGVDGVTYSNDCIAAASGMVVDYPGDCVP